MRGLSSAMLLTLVALGGGCGGEEAPRDDPGYLAPFAFVPPRVRPARPEKVAPDPETGLVVVRGEAVVALGRGKTRQDLERELAEARIDARVVGDVESLGVFQLEVPAADEAAVRRAIEALPSVEGAMPNGLNWPTREFDDAMLRDGDAENDWGIRAIRAPAAWDSTLGEGVTVAVVDSGCDPAHEDLRDRYATPYSFSTRSDGTDLSFADAGYHGTHVAGTIAATAGNGVGTAGIAPGATIVSLQALYLQRRADGTEDIYVTDADLLAALTLAIGRGAQVVNMSLGPRYPKEMQEQLDDPTRRDALVAKLLAVRDERRRVLDPVLRQAAERGVVCVVSAGNNARPAHWSPLPSSPYTISVGAIGPDLRATSFSSYREPSDLEGVDLSAPGAAIWSCRVGGGYVAEQGTSMAAPHVAGTVALLKAVRPSTTFAEVREVLVRTARPLDGGPDVGPRLDAAAAVEEMVRRRDADRPPPTSRPPAPPPDQRFPPGVRWQPSPGTITIVIQLGAPARCWLCDLVRFLVELFLRVAIPVEGGRFDEYGRAVRYPDRVALGPPPDLQGRERIVYVWDNRARLQSRNLGALEGYVVKEADQAVREAEAASPSSPPPSPPPPTDDATIETAFVRRVRELVGNDPKQVDRGALLEAVRADSACVPGGIMILGVDSEPEKQRVEEEHLATVRGLLTAEAAALDAIDDAVVRNATPAPFPRGLVPWARVALVAHAYAELAATGQGKAYEAKARVLLERLARRPEVAKVVTNVWPAVAPTGAAAAREAEMGFAWDGR